MDARRGSLWIVGEEGHIEPADIPPSVSIVLNDGDLDWSARKWAAKELRTALAQGRVSAYGLRSYSEKPDLIEPVEWNSREVPIAEFAGVQSWQIEPYSCVVVSKDEIKRIWPVSLASDSKEGNLRGRRGRRKGVGSLAAKDAPLIGEMHRMLSQGEVFSSYAAATLLLGSAAGAGSDESKRKRLVDRYREQFPND